MKVIFFILLLFIGGCQSLQPITDAQRQLWAKQQANNQQLQQWVFTASVVANGQEQGWHARLHWKQKIERYRLQLSGPVGQGTFILKGNAQQVSLRDSQGNRLEADNATALLKKITPIPFPVDALHDWVRGLPATDTPMKAYQLDAQGRLSQLQQQDWTIDYEDYRHIDGYWLPHKIILENSDYLIRIGISTWKMSI